MTNSQTSINLPPFNDFSEVTECPPEPSALIEGLFDKMILTGASKSGKTMALMDLALAVLNGGEWLGRQCALGSVLYVNMEVKPEQFNRRFWKIQEARGYRQHKPDESPKLSTWSLRGYRLPELDILADEIIQRISSKEYKLVIIEPFYKLHNGDENSAKDIAQACNLLDRIATGSGASVAIAHHYAKGFSGGKSVIDRGSGSGVIARDADLLLTMTELEGSSGTGYRIEGVSRNTAKPDPIDVWFEYPVFKIDETGELAEKTYSRPENASTATRKTNIAATRQALKSLIDNDTFPTVDELATASGVTRRSIYKYLKDDSGGMETFTAFTEGDTKTARVRFKNDFQL